MRDGLGRIESVALVGATSEIGLAAARALAEIGGRRFILAGRPSSERSAAASELGSGSVEVDLDLTDASSAREGVERIFGEGDVDVVVLAAGQLVRQPSPEDAVEMAQVNYVGTLAVLLAAAEKMARQGHGQVVVLSSAGVTRPRPANFVYGSTKAAIDFAARGLALEMKEKGVTVTIVRPNFVHTRMTAGLRPAPLAIRPEQVGTAIAEAVANQTGGIVWVPRAVAMLARILQLLPAPVVARLDR